MAIAAAAIIGGASLVGGMMSAGAASDAADAQVASAREASATQLKMFEQARADQAPWLTRGNQAGDLLSTYLGLPGSSGAAPGMPPPPTPDQFMVTSTLGGGGRPKLNYLGNDYSGPAWEGVPRGMNPALLGGLGGQTTKTVDQAAYQHALADWNAKNSAAMEAMKSDPRFGSLLKEFTGANLRDDPGYQFELKQGEDTITNQRAALGSLLSGATLKDLTKYGNDYAGTKFNEAFTRDQANKSFINNVLAGQSGTGQVAATNIGNQGVSTGNAIGQNIMGAGNARASGYVGAANALTGSLQSGYGNYMSAQMLKSLMPATSGGGVGLGGGGSTNYSQMG